MSRASRIGASVVRNQARWKRLQSHLGLKADGWPGEDFLGTVEEKLGLQETTPKRKPSDVSTLPASGNVPSPDYHSMVRHYGPPCKESNLVRIRFPYKMRLYSRSAPANLVGHRVHKKAAASLVAALQEIKDTYGMAWIREHGLDVFGGIFNCRSTRGGSSKSKHSWGAAIDLNPNENRNRQKWRKDKIGHPGWANMPIEAINIFKKHGWKSGAKAWGRDAMHFQRTR